MTISINWKQTHRTPGKHTPSSGHSVPQSTGLETCPIRRLWVIIHHPSGLISSCPRSYWCWSPHTLPRSFYEHYFPCKPLKVGCLWFRLEAGIPLFLICRHLDYFILPYPRSSEFIPWTSAYPQLLLMYSPHLSTTTPVIFLGNFNAQRNDPSKTLILISDLLTSSHVLHYLNYPLPWTDPTSRHHHYLHFPQIAILSTPYPDLHFLSSLTSTGLLSFL